MVMDDIDKLIKKYGHDTLIQIIAERKQQGYVPIVKKRGAPRVTLGEIWGLRDVFNYYQSIHPHEKKKYVADKVLQLLVNYRKWGEEPSMYAKELADNKIMYQHVSWLASKPVVAKTILNKLSEDEKNKSKRRKPSPYWRDFMIAAEKADLKVGEVFEDDPRDYL